MKIKIYSVLLLLASIFSLMSCLSTDNEVVTYDETAISTFTLGTLSRTLNAKTSAGKDTTITETFSGSSYPFYVDQKSGNIWNPDSLPYGTKINAVLCNISTVNGGVACILNQTRDSLNFWHNTDSIDFSYDRGIRIMSNSGKFFRDYNVHVNRCQMPKYRTEWTAMPLSTQIGSLEAGMHMISANGNIIIYGSDATATYAYSTTDGMTWNALGTIGNADTWKNIVGYDNKAYMIDGDGKLMCSEDGASFSTVADVTAYGIAKLIGGSKTQFFSLSNDGLILVSNDKGETWKADTLITTKDIPYMPDENQNLVSIQHKINPDMTIDIMVGTSSSIADKAVVWRKIENEHEKYAGWDCITIGNEAKKQVLPKLHDLCAVSTGGYLVAIGGTEGENGVTITNNIWVSKDQGLTWLTTTDLQLPKYFDTNATAWSATVDKDGHIWIALGKTGQVWKLKINDL